MTANEEARPNDATVSQTAMGGPAYAGATADQPGTNPYVTDQFLADIAAAAGDNDIVIPYFHFGVEYMGVPPDWAVEGARAAVDAGATMVVTHHPHVIQGMEIYTGKPIVYSCGNFIFDQMFSVEVRDRDHPRNRHQGRQSRRSPPQGDRDRRLPRTPPHDRRRTRRPHGPLLALDRPDRGGGAGMIRFVLKPV